MKEKEHKIVEITLDDLPKCSSFWGYPNTRLEEFLKSGTRKVFAYKIGDEYVGGCALMAISIETGVQTRRKPVETLEFSARFQTVSKRNAYIIGETQSGHFSDFFVREDLRGKGIGSRILEFAINCFKDKGIKTIRLHVFKNNLSAIRLYEKYGFRRFEDMTSEKIAMILTL